MAQLLALEAPVKQAILHSLQEAHIPKGSHLSQSPVHMLVCAQRGDFTGFLRSEGRGWGGGPTAPAQLRWALCCPTATALSHGRLAAGQLRSGGHGSTSHH